MSGRTGRSAVGAGTKRRGLGRLLPSLRGTGAPSTAGVGVAAPSRLAIAMGITFVALLGALGYLLASSPAPAGADIDACPNATLRTGPAKHLPDCRAYEQVSPVDKNGGDILGNELTGDSVAADGSRVILSSLTEFADASHGGGAEFTEYFAERGAESWSVVAMAPRSTPTGSTSVSPSSSDLSHSVLQSGGVIDSTPPDPAGNQDSNVYLRDNTTGIVSPLVASSSNGTTHFSSPVADPDLTHIAFRETAVLTLDPGVPEDTIAKTYELTNGGIRLVGLMPPSNTPHDDAVSPGGVANFNNPSSTVGAVSEDGRHVFFTTYTGSINPLEVYRRTDGTTTSLATPSRSTTPDPEGSKSKVYRFATPDGNRVLFTSSEHLTDDANTGPSRAGEDLYRYDFAADELVDISATSGGDGARVLGIMGSSESADRVYYVANGQVVPGEGADGEPNLFLWEDDGTPDGQTRFIATLAASDHLNWFQLNGDWTARTTPDGRQLVFQSEASIPGHPSGGAAQVYRYDATADGGAGQLDCVSCNPNGQPPIGPSSVTQHDQGNSAQYWELPNALSDDGSRVFFNSLDKLTSRDSNARFDAYMWEDGELHLLSSGSSARHSYFYNASEDGDDAFILTADALVPQDNDDLVDLYDVKVGGGLAGQFPVEDPGCSADVCQGPGSSPPGGSSPGSGDYSGSGNVGAGERRTLAISGLSARALKNAARRGVLSVRVRSNRAGVVRLLAQGRIGRRSRRIGSASRRLSRPGVVTLRVKLIKGARRQLRRTGALRVVVVARASGARQQSLTATLRRPGR